MINLLPQKEKQALVFQKNINLTMVLGGISVVFLICLALVLLSLEFYILQQVSVQDSILDEVVTKYQTKDFVSLLGELQNYNSVLTKTDSFYKKQTYATDVLRIILNVERPEGITFNRVSIDQMATNKIVKVNIEGNSLTRDNLILYKNNIEKQENIKNIVLPPSSLVKPSNVSFNLTFDVDESKLIK